jgi:hypothetical protein
MQRDVRKSSTVCRNACSAFNYHTLLVHTIGTGCVGEVHFVRSTQKVNVVPYALPCRSMPSRAGSVLESWTEGPKELRSICGGGRTFAYPPVLFFLLHCMFLNSRHKYHRFILSSSFHHRAAVKASLCIILHYGDYQWRLSATS